jgi:uncharacterized protein DUF3306
MSEEENFLARWARLKRVSDQERAAGPESAAPSRPGASAAASDQEGGLPASAQKREPGEPPVDLASLPSLDSITAGSDIRAFLQSGVPAELTKAALRRAWSSDPAIRDFIEIAENQWDFANPSSIPGFGPLSASDNIGELVSRAMGGLGHDAVAGLGAGRTATPDSSQAPTDLPAQATQGPDTVSRGEGPAVSSVSEEAAQSADKAVLSAVQQRVSRSDSGPASNSRRHGGALPQ